MHPRSALRLAVLGVLALAAFPWNAAARSYKPRFGFQHFNAHYIGGYSVTAPDGALAGPADIRIHVSRDGRSAGVIWKNTFYTPQGSHRIAIRWTFLRDGTVIANTLDPRASQLAGTGKFALVGNHPISFTATSTSADAEASGVLRLIGGGALSITATLTGLPEGNVTYSFSGGRKR